MYYIYRITNVKNGKLYFGQTKNFKNRKYTHLNTLKRNEHHNPHLQSAYNKYGENAFKFDIMEECSIGDVDEREIYYINKFNTSDNKYGYNYQSGGNLNKIISEETKRKISEATKGENNPFYNKKHSIESKEKMRIAKLGNKASDSHKLSLAKKSNKTGIYRVYKYDNPSVSTEVQWVYHYRGDGFKKVISNIDLLKLKENVIECGFEWFILDEKKAKKSFEENRSNMDNYVKYVPSEETKEKIRAFNLGKKIDMETKTKISSTTTKTGFFRVRMENDKRYQQGFRWKYGYYDENNKRRDISSTNLIKLKKNVINKNLEWYVVNEVKAEKSIVLNNSLFDLNLSLEDYC